MEDLEIMPNLLDRRRLKDRIVESISKAVKNIQLLESSFSSGSDQEQDLVLHNTDWQFCKLVEHLDHAFLHGLKHVTNGYWAIVQEFTHTSTVRDIKRLTKVVTDLGRSRAWLYQALVDRLLESYIRCYLDNTKRVKSFYAQDALVLDEQRLQLILTLSSGIERVRFELELDVPYLDLSSHQPIACNTTGEEDDCSSSQYTESPTLNHSSRSVSPSPSCSSLAFSVTDFPAQTEEIEVIPVRKKHRHRPSQNGQRYHNLVTSPAAPVTKTGVYASLGSPQSPESGYRSILDELPNSNHSSSNSMTSSTHSDRPTSINLDGSVSQRSPDPSSGLLAKHNDPPAATVTGLPRVSPIPVSSGPSPTKTILTRTVQEDELLKRILDDDFRLDINPPPHSSTTSPTFGPSSATGINSSLPLLTSHADTPDLNPAIVVTPCEERKEDFPDSGGGIIETNPLMFSVSSSVVPNSVLDGDKDTSSSENNVTTLPCSSRFIKRVDADEVSIYDDAKILRNASSRSSPLSPAGEPANRRSDDPLLAFGDFSRPIRGTKQRLSCSDMSRNFSSQKSDASSIARSVSGSGFSTATSRDSTANDSTNTSAGVLSRPSSVASTTSLELPVSHPCQVRVDNNRKLVIMLEIFQFPGEKFHKMFRCTLGHAEGDVHRISLLITDHALYLLNGGTKTVKFTKRAVVTFQEIDYISLSVDKQIVNIVCKARRKQFWICTGEEELTRCILESIEQALKLNDDSSMTPQLTVLTDATTQKIVFRKHASKECHVEMPDVNILGYFLVYWEDAVSLKKPCLSVSTASKEGLLMVKSYNFTYNYMFGGSTSWTPTFFVLRDGVLCQYDSEEQKTLSPRSKISLRQENCQGCRRSKGSKDRSHCFEVLFAHGPPLELSALTADEECEWINALCMAVTSSNQTSAVRYLKGTGCVACCSFVTEDRLFFCHEDVLSNFVRTIGSVPIALLNAVHVDLEADSCCLLSFESTSHKSVRKEKCGVYLSSAVERERFVGVLKSAYEKKVKKALRVEFLDVTSAYRCRDGVVLLSQLRQVVTT